MTTTEHDKPAGSSRTRSCRKCRCAIPRRRARQAGRPRVYCSAGCREAVKLEVRRLDRTVTRAEDEVQRLRLRVDEGFDVPPAVPRQLEWWRGELARLEARLRDLLDDPDESV